MIELQILSEADVPSVFDVYRTNPQYFKYAHNPNVSIKDVYEDIVAKPENVSLEKKHYLVMRTKGEIVGVVDLLRDYPFTSCAYIGLFMIHGSRHHEGLGRDGVEAILNWAQLHELEICKLGVIKENKEALSFWIAMGFDSESEKTIMMNGIETVVVSMKRTLEGVK